MRRVALLAAMLLSACIPGSVDGLPHYCEGAGPTDDLQVMCHDEGGEWREAGDCGDTCPSDHPYLRGCCHKEGPELGWLVCDAAECEGD